MLKAADILPVTTKPTGWMPIPLAYRKKSLSGVAASKIAGQLNLNSDFD